MKKISQYKDEEALELLADLIEPLARIIADKEVLSAFKKKSKIAGVSAAIKAHKHDVFQMLAILDGTPVEEYHCNVFDLPIKALEILNDKELNDFFKSQSQLMDEESSGSATETGVEGA